MDHVKCKALKSELVMQPEPHLVPIQRFFDGNDDPGSIGCNLIEHPGVAAFQDVLVGLLLRTDVQAVHAQISEIDPGEMSWPYTDMIIVEGTIAIAELREIVGVLQPDEVGTAEEFDNASRLALKPGMQALCVWWD